MTVGLQSNMPQFALAQNSWGVIDRHEIQDGVRKQRGGGGENIWGSAHVCTGSVRDVCVSEVEHDGRGLGRNRALFSWPLRRTKIDKEIKKCQSGLKLHTCRSLNIHCFKMIDS